MSEHTVSDLLQKRRAEERATIFSHALRVTAKT